MELEQTNITPAPPPPKGKKSALRLFGIWLLQLIKLIALPFMPALNVLIRLIKYIFEAEFLTTHGKVNLASEVILLIGVTLVSVNALLVIGYKWLIFGDHTVSINAPINWLFWAFLACVILVTIDKMFSDWLKAKYPK